MRSAAAVAQDGVSGRAKFISDLKPRRLIHSECGQAKSPVHTINRQIRRLHGQGHI
jgi:hypothetical protein